MKTLKKPLVLLLILSCLFLGCAPRGADDPLAYQKNGFSCEISWKQDGSSYRAKLIADAPSPSGERNATLSFSAPKGLANLTFSLADGSCYLQSEDGESSFPEGLPFFHILSFFSIEGTIKSIEATEHKGEAATLLLVSLPERGDFRVILDPEEEIPLVIEGEGITLTVLWFVPADPEPGKGDL